MAPLFQLLQPVCMKRRERRNLFSTGSNKDGNGVWLYAAGNTVVGEGQFVKFRYALQTSQTRNKYPT